ncbi:isocitrate lyase/phosphoenolpyruvate mutase family protein [Streptomyces sp. NPDC058409]|uniref:isocitrate lyase/phosphoenolpyruvate mutase family protein n=1 Tax=Streptomyces sp. NPDC058409 TaxID=3346484 RepID=UPI0036506856
MDTHRLPPGDRTAWLDETLVRARAYAAAGANGIFVLGALETPTVRTLSGSVPLPLNVLAGPGAPSVSELAGAGVARISAGSSIAEAAYGLVRQADWRCQDSQLCVDACKSTRSVRHRGLPTLKLIVISRTAGNQAGVAGRSRGGSGMWRWRSWW